MQKSFPPLGGKLFFIVKIRDFSARFFRLCGEWLHGAKKYVKVITNDFLRRSALMKYDFTSIIDRRGRDAIAVDGLKGDEIGRASCRERV